MIIAGHFEVPDKCPENCCFKGDSWAISQGGMCHYCPVLNCSGIPEENPDYADEDGMFRLLQPEDYRPDWAAEWVQFFKDGTVPQLRFDMTFVNDDQEGT